MALPTLLALNTSTTLPLVPQYPWKYQGAPHAVDGLRVNKNESHGLSLSHWQGFRCCAFCCLPFRFYRRHRHFAGRSPGRHHWYCRFYSNGSRLLCCNSYRPRKQRIRSFKPRHNTKMNKTPVGYSAGLQYRTVS